MNITDAQPRINADQHTGEYAEGFDVTIAASDDQDGKVTVYYTQDGSDPSQPDNTGRRQFVDSKKFPIKKNGNHSISCYAKDSAGREAFQSFAWQIDDQLYPETSISPALGGMYSGAVKVNLNPSEKCAWTKYTSDGSDPDEQHGSTYSGTINIDKTTVLKFRSRDLQGKLEPVKSATFSIGAPLQLAVFDNDAEKDGHVKADPDGGNAFVGTFDNLEIGSGRGNQDSRAILHFDTSALPDNAVINNAYLEVKLHSKSGNPWDAKRRIAIDVQKGHFGSCRAIQADDWKMAATAAGVAHIDKFASGVTRSSDFSRSGMAAINRSGVTQIRLALTAPHSAPNNGIFIKGGSEAKLFVEYGEAK